jgi:protein CpxP
MEHTTMRKITIALGLGLALSIAGASAGAQSTRADSARRPSVEGRRGPGGPGERRGPDFDRGGRRGGGEGFLLRGITLTEAQKTQLQTLREQDRAQMASRRDEFQKEREQLRALREKGDTVAMRRAMEQRRAVMEQERARRTAALRNLLTAEQRVTFDKNVEEAKKLEATRGQRGAGKGAGKGGDRGRHEGHDRGQRRGDRQGK